MNLEEKFEELRMRREGAHMSHVYFGDPHATFSLDLIQTLADHGADMIEIGIPFSDPTADGATFQAACERALSNGTTPATCLKGIQKLRKRGIDLPIIVTTYYNIPYVTGLGAFMRELKEAGAQGIIVPNLPIEEARNLLTEGNRRDLHVILQATPTTTANRLGNILDAASGFLYVINVEGVTGVRDTLRASTVHLIKQIRRRTDVPVLAGFGISTKEHAAAVVSAGADGVIVGSAYAKIYANNLQHPDDTLPSVAHLAQQIKQGCIDGYPQRN
jgi:tryptophan synthase alpha chain